MAGQKRVKAVTPLAGSPAAPMRGGYYMVRPGGEGPEHFAASRSGLSALDAMCAAISRARWLSVGGPDQEVLVHREQRGTHVFFAFSHGVCTLRPDCVIAPQPPAPAAV